MLHSCSLMNSFNLYITQRSEESIFHRCNLRLAIHYVDTYSSVNAGSPEETVIRNWVLSAGSVSILT